MIVWITSYALTQGIIKVDANTSLDSGMVTYRPNGQGFMQFAHGNDWHQTEESALLRAEEMRIKKLHSLKKQVDKISSMKIKVLDRAKGEQV